MEMTIDKCTQKKQHKLKIAVVMGRFPEISETFILNHITGLIDLGHKVSIYAFGQSDMSKKIHKEIFDYRLMEKVIFFDLPKHRWGRAWKLLKVFLKILCTKPKKIFKLCNLKDYVFYEVINNFFKYDDLQKNQVEIIHCHFGTIGNEMNFMRDVCPTTKLFVTFHGYDILQGRDKGGEMYHSLFESANNVFAISSYNRFWIEKFGCHTNKIIDCRHGINLERFSLDDTRTTKEFIITTVARLVDEKNIFYALEIVHLLKTQHNINFKYNIIGKGYLKKSIELKIQELGLNDVVTLKGDLSRDEVVQELSKTHLFLLTSKNEAFALVLLEAQAMGIPVVATKVGGICDAIHHGETGYLVELDQADEVKSIILSFIEDSVKWKYFSENGINFVKDNFDIHNLIKKLEMIYLGKLVKKRDF